MPVVFRYKGYRFFFFSNEGDLSHCIFMSAEVRQ